MTDHPTAPHHSQRGVVVVTALLLVGSLALWTTVGMTRATVELQTAQRSRDLAQAFHLAESGLEDGTFVLLAELADQIFDNADGVADDPVADGTITTTNPNLQGLGGYTVTITFIGNVAGGGQVFDLALYRVTSTGTTASGISQTTELTQQLDNPWKYALYSPAKPSAIRSDWHVLRNGTQVDAYRSTSGDYDDRHGPGGNWGLTALMADASTDLADVQRPGAPQAAVFAFEGTSAGADGRAGAGGANSTQTTITADVQVNVSDLAQAVQTRDGAEHIGQTLTLAYALTLQPFHTPPECDPDPNNWLDGFVFDDNKGTNQWDLGQPGQGVALCFKSDVVINPGVTVNWNGILMLGPKAHLIISDGATLTPSSNPATGGVQPSDFLIAALDSTDHSQPAIDGRGAGILRAGVYAPGRNVTLIGNGSHPRDRFRFYGVLVARRGTFDGTELHQDLDIYGSLLTTPTVWNQL